jgi:hypothetical protein
VTADALVERNPLGVQGADDDPLHLAALLGIAVGLDQGRRLAA